VKASITPHSIANAVRMGDVLSHAPVFISESDEDIKLVAAMASKVNVRIVPAHTRQNAVRALEELLKTGWAGIIAVLTPEPEKRSSMMDSAQEVQYDFTFEGNWEEIYSHSTEFAGHKVRLMVLPNNGNGTSNGAGSNQPRPNVSMLKAIKEIETIQIGMEPAQGKDTLEYLREAREGGMYDAANDS
jgi:hypothetical protein